ncbi:hypothetical protein L1987_29595 [Smallanthus sonchifolius]|uniref:Uncharacterized protein n=1 Tax=Smallanthus sonchifolius TaxID=185202 RepID=A0ACB9I1W3_9ASTR|nr:hypothetical protein L1987_29595 [Smallanthus sonchifolius]
MVLVVCMMGLGLVVKFGALAEDFEVVVVFLSEEAVVNVGSLVDFEAVVVVKFGALEEEFEMVFGGEKEVDDGGGEMVVVDCLEKAVDLLMRVVVDGFEKVAVEGLETAVDYHNEMVVHGSHRTDP